LSNLFSKLLPLERAVSSGLFVPTSSRWRWLAAAGAHLGDGILWAIVGLILAIWGGSFWRTTALTTTLAVLLSTAISTAIKYTIRRHRPHELAEFYTLNNDRYSFPSGHATRMAAIALVIAWTLPRLAVVSYCLALVVAVCRVAVGVHYPSDVLTGLVIGSFGAACILFLF
jgi:undecaprenyl-diphosphatase